MMYRDKPNEIFGYCIPEKQTVVDLQERQLCALEFSFGCGRIQAVLPHFEAQACEPEYNWIGVAESTCTQRRLQLKGDIKVMRG